MRERGFGSCNEPLKNLHPHLFLKVILGTDVHTCLDVCAPPKEGNSVIETNCNGISLSNRGLRQCVRFNFERRAYPDLLLFWKEPPRPVNILCPLKDIVKDTHVDKLGVIGQG